MYILLAPKVAGSRDTSVSLTTVPGRICRSILLISPTGLSLAFDETMMLRLASSTPTRLKAVCRHVVSCRFQFSTVLSDVAVCTRNVMLIGSLRYWHGAVVDVHGFTDDVVLPPPLDVDGFPPEAKVQPCFGTIMVCWSAFVPDESHGIGQNGEVSVILLK